MPISACIFDMDGVIVDTARFHFKAWHRLADTLSIPFTEEQNEQLKGVSRVDSLERILSWGNLVLSGNKKIELMNLKNKWYLEYVEQVSPADMLPGVPEFLNELHKEGILIGLGSSSKNSILILNKLGITGLFSTIVDGTKIHLSKPNPDVFLRGAQELKCAPQQCVVFEDAISGVEAAKSGGFRCIGIGDASILAQADAVVPDMQGMSISRMKSLLGE
jgi:beta-phosphoglucomutase